MAFEDTIRLIEETRRYMNSLESTLTDAERIRNRLDREILEAKEKLRNKEQDTDYPNNLAAKIISEMRQDGSMSSLLISEIDNAIFENEEFSRTPYRMSLYEVAQDPDIFFARKTGDGWNSSLRIQIIFESVAGNSSDWARGIETFRQVLKTKTGADKGGRATSWWYANVYRGSLEARTILERLDFSGRTAPFWQILNSGSHPLPSDRGDGSYNPVPANPTDFIGKAEDRILAEFTSLFNPERLRWEEEIRLFQREIQKAENISDDFTEEINQLRADAERDRRIQQEIEESTRRAREIELEEEAKRYRVGEEFSKPAPEDGQGGFFGKVKKFAKKAIGKVRGIFDL